MKIRYHRNALGAHRTTCELLPCGITSINIHVRKEKYPEFQNGWADIRGALFGGRYEITLFKDINTQNNKLLFTLIYITPESDLEAQMFKGQHFERNLKWELEIIIIPDKLMYPHLKL